MKIVMQNTLNMLRYVLNYRTLRRSIRTFGKEREVVNVEHWRQTKLVLLHLKAVSL